MPPVVEMSNWFTEVDKPIITADFQHLTHFYAPKSFVSCHCLSTIPWSDLPSLRTDWEQLPGEHLKRIGMFEGLVVFCLGIGVARHSAGDVGLSVYPCICTWYVQFAMCMQCSKSDYEFCLWIYQDREHTMNSKHDQCTSFTFIIPCT